MYSNLPSWALNVLQVYNVNSPGTYTYWYDFIRQSLKDIPGDIIEVGVYRGRTFCATAYLISELYPTRKVIGFDSFTGFPSVDHPNDQTTKFKDLYQQGLITKEHYDLHLLNLELANLVGRAPSTAELSTSGNFSSTSSQLVKDKLNYLSLSNYNLVEGDVSKTMINANLPEHISAVFLDADLYDPYKSTLSSVWPKLSIGGIIYLDEYFSLKFPGPRIAVLDFLSKTDNAELICIEKPIRSFERWIIKRTS